MKHSKRRREYEMWRAEYHKMKEAMKGCPEHGVPDSTIEKMRARWESLDD